jgi:acyl-CoA thioester hydrolase
MNLNESMKKYQYYHPIEVRYADIDAQRHVNSKCYFTYMEQARVKFIQALELWSGIEFDALGMILAEQSCRYIHPITYGQHIRVGVRTSRVGTKSFELTYSIQDAQTEKEMAVGRTVLVTYDYTQGKSIPIPDTWRKAISQSVIPKT